MESNTLGATHPELPSLGDLHERHPGITPALCIAYAEAAAICLSNHHTSPTAFEVNKFATSQIRLVLWNEPDDRQKAAWNNADDATRDGAYALSLSVAEAELDLVAISRAETRTGADYYMAPRGTTSLEEAFRLEVSGLDRGSPQEITKRLQAKITQAQRGRSNLPALAVVVGFRARQVRVARVTEK